MVVPCLSPTVLPLQAYTICLIVVALRGLEGTASAWFHVELHCSIGCKPCRNLLQTLSWYGGHADTTTSKQHSCGVVDDGNGDQDEDDNGAKALMESVAHKAIFPTQRG